MRDSNDRRPRPYSKPDRRTRESPLDDIRPVVLTRKYANAIDGIDLVGREIGHRLALNPHDADLLVAEGWARPATKKQRRHPVSAAESPHYPRPSVKPKARKRPAPGGEALVRSVTVKLKARKGKTRTRKIR